MASILYYSGSDPVSISKRIGHARVSTTQDMYFYLIRQADTQSAERIADAYSEITNRRRKHKVYTPESAFRLGRVFWTYYFTM